MTTSSGFSANNNNNNNNNLAPFGSGSASSSSAPSPFAVGAGSNGSTQMPASPFAQRTPSGQLPSPFAPRNNNNDGGFGSTHNNTGQVFGGFGSNQNALVVPNKIVFGGGRQQNQQQNPSPCASISSLCFNVQNNNSSIFGGCGGDGSRNMNMME